MASPTSSQVEKKKFYLTSKDPGYYQRKDRHYWMFPSSLSIESFSKVAIRHFTMEFDILKEEGPHFRHFVFGPHDKTYHNERSCNLPSYLVLTSNLISKTPENPHGILEEIPVEKGTRILHVEQGGDEISNTQSYLKTVTEPNFWKIAEDVHNLNVIEFGFGSFQRETHPVVKDLDPIAVTMMLELHP